MKSFKKIFENINILNENILNENIQKEMKSIFKGDKEYERLKKAAKKDQDDVPDFLDYMFNIIGDNKMEKISKKYQMDMDVLAKEFMK